MPSVDLDEAVVWDMLSEPRMARTSKPQVATKAMRYVCMSGVRTPPLRPSKSSDISRCCCATLSTAAFANIFREDQCGIPWFLLPTPGGEHVADAVVTVRERLRLQRKESRHQIIAGLNFGFWSGLLGPKYEDLWRECLHRAFPNSSGKRKQVAVAVERVRKFRNRLAHHDSTINVDVPFEIRQIFELTAYVDGSAARWLEQCSEVMAVYARRPVTVADTVVVPAKNAWSLYEECRAYVCQSGRAFRPVQRIAFYADREIKPDVPSVIYRRDNVEWTAEAAARLRVSADRFDRKIATVIDSSMTNLSEGRYQVFLLTGPGHPDHRQLSAVLPHGGSGRGSAFVQRQRYVSLHSLETATTTADL